jgi:glutathione S-transferase
MITLYGSGRRFGLPDASPFVSKAEILLKMSGAPYALGEASFSKAPKGKIPYIADDDRLLGDSTFIRFYLEKKFGIDFDGHLAPADRATAWAYEKMCEDHLYWAIVQSRWLIPRNFEKGPRRFFDKVPFLVRPFVLGMVKRQVRKSLYGQGLGRHSQAEIEALAARDLDAVSAFLASKPWLMGEAPCGADAAVWSMISGALCPHFDTPIRTEAEKHPNLVAYRDRGMRRWFPELI